MGKKQKQKNREIMTVTYGFVALFLCMIGYLIYFTAVNEEKLINNSYNPRQKMLAEQNSRGSIFARNTEILAQTVFGKDGEEIREYPYGNLFAHSIGYSTYGKTGLEAHENYYLIHSDIPFSEKTANEISGKKNPGNNVYTTLDVSLQEAADKALGIYEGAVIAMKPKTGEILAMVSKPDFDPNYVKENWEKLSGDQESGVLLNRVSQGLYPPGSTFKIVTALQYIRENPDTYQNYQYECSGSFQLGDEKIKCYHGVKHGSVDLNQAFAKSCNSAFASMVLELDKKAFGETLNKLFLNQELDVNLIYNQSKLLINQNTSDADMIQSVIGQGKTQITPLHLTMITASIANDGVMMKPYLTDRIEAADGTLVKTYKNESMGSVMSEKEAVALTNLMEEVVKRGTATKLSEESYSAAGKTGSAEFSKDKTESHAWFTGFAPADNPEIVVTVILEGAGSGGDYAVPIAKRIFDAYFKE